MPSVCAASVAVIWPERTLKITSARCLALAFIYSVFAGFGVAVGKLVYLLQPAGELVTVTDRCRFWSNVCKPWAQGFALGQVDPALQGLQHPLHRPLLPLVERDPVDVQLAADFRRFAPFRPHRQHGLDFVRGAVLGGVGVRLFPFRLFGWVGVLVEVIGKFLFVVLLITDTEFEFALLGTEHDGLAVHASHHVKGRLGFATQGQLQKIFLNAGFDGLAQLRLDLEETVRRTKTFDALVAAACGCSI